MHVLGHLVSGGQTQPVGGAALLGHGRANCLRGRLELDLGTIAGESNQLRAIASSLRGLGLPSRAARGRAAVPARSAASDPPTLSLLPGADVCDKSAARLPNS